MNNGIGVIVGRFQVDWPTQAHNELYTLVQDKHQQVVIVVGVHHAINTRQNPLDFMTRKLMLEQAFPKALIIPLSDEPTNEGWSRSLDMMLRLLFPNQHITLYGSRKSFLDYYTGSLHTNDLRDCMYSDVSMSATEQREYVADKALETKDFRKGMIYSAYQRFPTAVTTVDMAVWSLDRLLVIEKKGFDGFGLPGGFVDPTKDESYEHAAKRELYEETGLDFDINDLVYLGNRKIQDWRFVGAGDKVYTNLFLIQASKDYQTVARHWKHPENDTYGTHWIDPVKDFMKIAPNHRDLVKLVIDNLQLEEKLEL